jgi:hypothetical protein
MVKFKYASKDWTEYRNLPDLMEVDFHWANETSAGSYYDNMLNVLRDALDSLKWAHENDMQYVLFTHGKSTSRPGNTTSRSQIRKLMRSKEATPYITRSACIQQDSVFLAAIKPSNNKISL